MTLNGHYIPVLYCTLNVYFGADHANVNKDRPISDEILPIESSLTLCGY